MEPLDYVLGRLEAAGCDRATCRAILAPSPPTDVHARMLLAIALDLHAEALDIGVLAAAIDDARQDAVDPYARFCVALSGRVRDDFAKCVAAAPGGDLAPDESYVALVTFPKYAYFFRRRDGVAIGAGSRASELDYLRFNAGFEEPLPVELQRELRGQHRPISWVTRSSVVDPLFSRSEPPAYEAVALDLIEKLGLPWQAGPEHDVFILRYPAEFDGTVRIGRPNSFCECWDSPGLFVPAATTTGWGQTCGRARADHTGMPERVHEPVPAGGAYACFQISFIASVVLQEPDPAVAIAETARRWATLVATRAVAE